VRWRWRWRWRARLPLLQCINIRTVHEYVCGENQEYVHRYQYAYVTYFPTCPSMSKKLRF
jgi:hypothetical protein